MNALLLGPDLAATSDPGRKASAGSVVEWFGAMQAQDFASGKWSLGVRLPGVDEAGIHAALDAGEVVKTWPMRGTVHWVPPRDAKWMLEIMGSRMLTGLKPRWDRLGLDAEQVAAAADILGSATSGGHALTRAQCVEALQAGGLNTDGQRTYHLIWHTAQIGVICSGPVIGGEQAFVALDEWVPNPRTPSREEGLAVMALRYFRSHGPTTRQDFAGWMGVTAGDAKAGIAACGDSLVTVKADPEAGIAGDLVMAADALDALAAGPESEPAPVRVLPGFDEYLLGFKDRRIMLDPGYFDAVVPGGNGIFRATVVVDGRAVATWGRKVKKSSVQVDVTLLEPVPAPEWKLVEVEFERYSAYLGLPLDLRVA